MRAFVVPDILITHGLDRCFALIFAAGQGLFDTTLRFESNYSRVLANISMTALACSAQWAGFYEWHPDVLMCIGALIILTGMAQVCAISRMQSSVTPKFLILYNRVSARARTRIAFLELSCTRQYVFDPKRPR